jgi:DNA invertase Pin-like site-specific DNA recombinase
MGTQKMSQDALYKLREKYEDMHTSFRALNAVYGMAYTEGALDMITIILSMMEHRERKPDVRELEDP